MISLADAAALAKLRISLLSTFSAATGFVVVSRSLRPPLAATAAGAFLLAAGAAALNAVADRERDALMERTRERPIPAGRVGVVPATALALVSAVAGAAVLWRFAGPLPALLGIAALLWYDAVYTPLKRVTAFAVLPGAIVGALPPALGWTAGGGALGDGRLHALCAFVLVWQVPHAWLLALRHAEDYARAGFPTPASRLSTAQVGRVTRAWTLAAAGLALLLPLFGVTRGTGAAVALAVAAAALLPIALRLPRDAGRTLALDRVFVAVNGFALAVLALAAADALLG